MLKEQAQRNVTKLKKLLQGLLLSVTRTHFVWPDSVRHKNRQSGCKPDVHIFCAALIHSNVYGVPKMFKI